MDAAENARKRRVDAIESARKRRVDAIESARKRRARRWQQGPGDMETKDARTKETLFILALCWHGSRKHGEEWGKRDLFIQQKRPIHTAKET